LHLNAFLAAVPRKTGLCVFLGLGESAFTQYPHYSSHLLSSNKFREEDGHKNSLDISHFRFHFFCHTHLYIGAERKPSFTIIILPTRAELLLRDSKFPFNLLTFRPCQPCLTSLGIVFSLFVLLGMLSSPLLSFIDLSLLSYEVRCSHFL
jgi:hypothetical protein